MMTNYSFLTSTSASNSQQQGILSFLVLILNILVNKTVFPSTNYSLEFQCFWSIRLCNHFYEVTLTAPPHFCHIHY